MRQQDPDPGVGHNLGSRIKSCKTNIAFSKTARANYQRRKRNHSAETILLFLARATDLNIKLRDFRR
jgi:hypothetical protein